MVIKTIAALALVGSLGVLGQLASCSSSAVDVTAVQSATEVACSFLPTAASIASIVTANKASATAGVDEAVQIANLICGAVASSANSSTASAPAPGTSETVVVNVGGQSVNVTGQFV